MGRFFVVPTAAHHPARMGYMERTRPRDGHPWKKSNGASQHVNVILVLTQALP